MQNQSKFYCALDKTKILFGDTVEFCVETRMRLICCMWKQGGPENISWRACLIPITRISPEMYAERGGIVDSKALRHWSALIENKQKPSSHDN